MLKKHTKKLNALILLALIVTSVGCSSGDKLSIAVATGTTYADYVDNNFDKEKVKCKELDDDNLTLQELNSGKVDAVITDKLVALRAIKEEGFKDLEIAGDMLYKETIGIAIRQEDDALRQAINTALAEMIEDGTYAQISEKYFGTDILKGVNYEKTFKNDPKASDDSLQKVKDADEITFAMSGGYPPFNYSTEDDVLTGFDVDIGKEIAKKLGVKYKPIATGDFGALIEGLRAKRYDAILGSMAVNEKRLEVVDFTDPYYYSGAQIVVKKGSKIKGAETLK